ncbi:MAG: MBL fold metallo-hydrolase [Candidatus Tectomicrobia bacterium]|nr:MBL fold metallo-hydrolase [Candidatus Tectomicrobia bacterium]
MDAAATNLKAVDRVDITILLDNSIDIFLPSTEEVKRPQLADTVTWGERKSLLAEHGYAALVRVAAGERSAMLLFDAGISTHGLIHNMDVLEVKPADLQSIILSHGHIDHTQGLVGMLRRLGRRGMPVLLHPDAFLKRKVIFPDGHEINTPAPDRRLLEQEGVEFVEARGPSYLIEGMVLVTGQIHRSTDFERGFPIHYAEIDGAWRPDPLIHDDQALVVNVRGKGLVVLTGCGHAGAINTLRYARELTGVERIHALLGGLHLTGPIFEPIIGPTVAELRRIAPAIIMPGHCTGWKAIHRLAQELPEAYAPSSVGSRLVVEAVAAGVG